MLCGGEVSRVGKEDELFADGIFYEELSIGAGCILCEGQSHFLLISQILVAKITTYSFPLALFKCTSLPLLIFLFHISP